MVIWFQKWAPAPIWFWCITWNTGMPHVPSTGPLLPASSSPSQCCWYPTTSAPFSIIINITIHQHHRHYHHPDIHLAGIPPHHLFLLILTTLGFFAFLQVFLHITWSRISFFVKHFPNDDHLQHHQQHLLYRKCTPEVWGKRFSFPQGSRSAQLSWTTNFVSQNKPQPTFSLRKATCKKIISGCDKMPPRPGPGSWKRWHQGPPLHGSFKHFQLKDFLFLNLLMVAITDLSFVARWGLAGNKHTLVNNSNWRPE